MIWYKTIHLRQDVTFIGKWIKRLNKWYVYVTAGSGLHMLVQLVTLVYPDT
jgi:hypothetical protein